MRSVAALIIVLFAAPLASGAEEVSLLDGAVHLTIPDGYSQLTSKEILGKFPRNNRPPFAAFADAQRNATIAFTLVQQNQSFSEDQLPDLLASFEQVFPRMLAGLVWHEREVTSLGGRKWARLHLSAHAIDTDVKNDMYFTPLRGGIFGVNLTATVSKWDEAQPALATAFRSITIHEQAR